MKKFFILLIAIGFISCSSSSQNISTNKKDENIVKGEYIAILFKNSVTKSKVNNLKKVFSKYGVEQFELIGSDILKIKLKNDPGFEEIRKIASSRKEIKVIEQNRRVRLSPPPGERIQIK